jgi:hypothetical protein
MIGRPPTKSTIDSRGCWRDAVGNDASRRVDDNCSHVLNLDKWMSVLTRALFKRAVSVTRHLLVFDVAATSRSRHESDPSPFAVLTGSSLLGSAQARAA